MEAKSDFGLDKRMGEIHQLVCVQCRQKTKHKVLKSVTHDWATANAEIQGSDDYLVVQCMGCDHISYCTISINSEDYGDPHGNDPLIKVQQSPEVNLEHVEIALPYNTPYLVKCAYNETSRALFLGLTVLGAVGCGLVVELICKEEGANGDDLLAKIDSLYGQGIISKDVSDAIHGVRFFRNDAAHKAKVKDHELKPAWRTVNMIISYIYGSRDDQEMLLTPSRMANLEQERQKRA